MNFDLTNVKPDTQALRNVTHIEQIKRLLDVRSIEAVSKPPKLIVPTSTSPQCVEAVGVAFARHYPLVLSPDSVWLTISQGLANHINKYAEDVRKKFVAHEGKVQIVIQRDGFIKGAPDNDWEGAFAEFSSHIKGHIGSANHQMIVADFSTTGAVERAASEVVLMDAMQSYFEYGMMTCCGIPNVELTGTVEDWEKLRAKIDGWTFDGVADLSWWTTPLKRVLDTFVETAKGKIDKQWWESIYKENSQGGSGAVSKISGWVNWLFPYTQKKSWDGNSYNKEFVKNIKVGVTGLEYGDGLKDEDYPSSMAKVPFEWNYFGAGFNMELMAGITAVAQDPVTTAISPNVGWAVRELGTTQKSKIDWKKPNVKGKKS
jgi:hypothetical protein